MSQNGSLNPESHPVCGYTEHSTGPTGPTGCPSATPVVSRPVSRRILVDSPQEKKISLAAK